MNPDTTREAVGKESESMKTFATNSAKKKNYEATNLGNSIDMVEKRQRP